MKLKSVGLSPDIQMFVETAGEIFSDGVVLDLMHGAKPSEQPQLIVCDGEGSRVVSQYDRNGAIYVPIAIHPTVASAVRFPSGVISYGSTRELFAELVRLVSWIPGVCEHDVRLIGYFMLSDWLSERIDPPPFLWIIAPPTVSTCLLFHILRLLCRRAIVVTDPTSSGLRTLPMQLRPTLVVEVSTVTRALLRTLRATNRKRASVSAGAKLLDPSCPKIVVACAPPLDPAMVGFPLEIALAPEERHTPPLDLAEVEQICAELQKKLESYRLTNLNAATAVDLDLDGLTPPMREAARNFATCVVDDKELRAGIVALFESRDREIRIDRTTRLEAITLEPLLVGSHDASGMIPVMDLTAKVNSILTGRGSAEQVSPEKVGWILRSLGLRTESIRRGLKGLVLNDQTKSVIHRLARAYGVRSLQHGVLNTACQDCLELGLAALGDEQDSEPEGGRC
jgi:hypothetical protein